MTTTSPSSPSSRPSTGGSSSTTFSPKTYFAWASSDGSWRPHCSRLWPENTVPRSPRWLESTKATTETRYGPRRCFQVTVQRQGRRKQLVARFGGIPLKRQPKAVLTDLSPVMASARRNELIHRLLAGHCEICEAEEDLEVHHIRKLADLNRPDRRE